MQILIEGRAAVRQQGHRDMHFHIACLPDPHHSTIALVLDRGIPPA
jgi:hypothetical protein